MGCVLLVGLLAGLVVGWVVCCSGFGFFGGLIWALFLLVALCLLSFGVFVVVCVCLICCIDCYSGCGIDCGLLLVFVLIGCLWV